LLCIINRTQKPSPKNATIADSHYKSLKDSHSKDDKNTEVVVENSRRRRPKGKTATKDEGEVREVEDYKSEEGGAFTGTLKNNKRNGKGTLRLPNEYEYIGEWCDDLFDGKGKLIQANGDTFEGTWLAGKLNGEGKIKLSSGYTLEATFVNSGVNDKPQGKGKEIDVDGTVYEGEFFEGKKHGEGVMRLAEGKVYEGQFEDGVYHGKGKLTKADGSTYEGTFLLNTRRKFCERKAGWIRCLHLD
jgi:hypothetical protein